jgi:transcriptional regulator with XRE-family HTH domain
MVNTKMLIARMKELGISQQELADNCSVKRPTMNQKLHNVRPISLNEAQIIQRTLHIPENEFGAYFFSV